MEINQAAGGNQEFISESHHFTNSSFTTDNGNKAESVMEKGILNEEENKTTGIQNPKQSTEVYGEEKVKNVDLQQDVIEEAQKSRGGKILDVQNEKDDENKTLLGELSKLDQKIVADQKQSQHLQDVVQDSKCNRMIGKDHNRSTTERQRSANSDQTVVKGIQESASQMQNGEETNNFSIVNDGSNAYSELNQTSAKFTSPSPATDQINVTGSDQEQNPNLQNGNKFSGTIGENDEESTAQGDSVENVSPDSPNLKLKKAEGEKTNNFSIVNDGSNAYSELNEISAKFTPPSSASDQINVTGEITHPLKDTAAFGEDQNLNSTLQGSSGNNISYGANLKANENDTVATSCTSANITEKLPDIDIGEEAVEGDPNTSSEMPSTENSNINSSTGKEVKTDTPEEKEGSDAKKETLEPPKQTSSDSSDKNDNPELQSEAQSSTQSEEGEGTKENSKSNISAFENLTASKELRTLEECLEAFGMFPRLLQLDESLVEVRRYRNTAEKHEKECQLLDKDLLKLSLEYHPDRVMQRGGTEEEKTRGKELQAALNAIRTVLKTLSKIFLEDIDIEHKYEFYTKLDISLLRNEDEVEKQAFQVLFNISLISEIKQGTIVGDVMRFLNSAQHCVRNFQTRPVHFTEYRRLAFSCLERCVTEYRKLYTEHEEVEKQCGKENLSNVYPTVHKMKRDCRTQLKHMEALLALSNRPLGESFPMYTSTFPVDDYLVLPFVCYTNVILSCSLMEKLISEEHQGGWFSFLPSPRALLGNTARRPTSRVDLTDDDISLLYQLALCYSGNAEYTQSLKELFGWPQASKAVVKGQFFVTLERVRKDLEGRFKLTDYVVKNSKKDILKELRVYRRMASEINQRTRGLEDDLEEMRRNSDYVRRRLDEVMRNQSEVSNQLGEMSRRTSPKKSEN